MTKSQPRVWGRGPTWSAGQQVPKSTGDELSMFKGPKEPHRLQQKEGKGSRKAEREAEAK